MGAYCLAMAVQGTYPFGGRSRAVNDLGNQFVPFHARLRDLMHGDTSGDLLFNWASGFGTPFLADFFTYLMNPFSWLVGVFPRDAVEFPVFLVTLFSVGLAAGLMTVFLGRLHPGSPWLRALLSVGFGLSAWMISDGFSDPMWMWGLVAFPVLGIAYDWCLDRRHWVLGALAVSVCWAGNFYTAAMATIGMALVLLVRVLLDERPAAERVRVLARGASMTVAGVLLVAPVLTVSLKASKLSQPAPEVVYKGSAFSDYAAHLFPGGLAGGAPRVSVGMLALLLVAAYAFIGRVPLRERVAWLGLTVAVAASLVWQPTILLWHGLAMPNGNPYRASIALTAVLVCVAWLALARRPRPKELLRGAALVLVLAVCASGAKYMSAGPWILAVVGGPVFLALLVLLHRHRADRRARAWLTVALAGAVLLSSAATVFSTTRLRDAQEWWTPKRTYDAETRAAYARLKAADEWPASRTETGPNGFAANDPMLLAGQGGRYYSSYLPAVTAETLHGLGAGWFIQGRHTNSFNDPVGRAIMGVSSYLVPAPGPTGFVQRTAVAPPVVTLRPPGAPLDGTAPDATPDATVFARQERVLGARVYEVPAFVRAGAITQGGADTALVPGRGWPLKADRPRGAGATFTAACAPGTEAYLHVPWLAGKVQALGRTVKTGGKEPMTSVPLIPLGTVPADGRVTVKIHSSRGQFIPSNPLGCLDRAALDRAVQHLRATGPEHVEAGGHGISAVFAPGTKGTAIVSVPAATGWRCSVDGGQARAPRTLGGLMAVDLGDGASRVSCSFHTPGLRLGLAVGAATAALLLAVAVGHALRTRTPRSTPRSRRS
ncbi:YfhO family protein [Streptomyces sp. NPDC047971]|uniref:YfhO family protein n=1 Tax=Streptomyces sp. NPDC047971 TaxID=3154499 RepID=UPI00340BA90D